MSKMANPHTLTATAWNIAVLGLGLRIATIFFLPTSSSPEPFEYEVLTSNLLAGKGYTIAHLETIYRSFHSAVPYVLLNAAVCGLTDHQHTILLLAQSVLTGLLILVVYRIATVVFDPRTAALAALLTTFHPGLFAYDVQKLHPLSLDALLIASSVLASISLRPRSSWLWRVTVGGLIGLALLERGTLVLFIPVAILLASRASRPTPSGAVRYALPLLLGISLTFGPWVARNFIIHRTFVVMTMSGELFWRGNNPSATGTSLTRDGRPILSTSGQEFRSTVTGLDELGQMRFFFQAGWAFWLQSPVSAALLYLKKLLYFFSFAPTTGLLYSPWKFRLYIFYYFICALSALAGSYALIIPRKPSPSHGLPRILRLLPLLCIVSVGVMQSIFYVEARHRWGVEPLILILAAAGMIRIFPYTTSVNGNHRRSKIMPTEGD